MDKCIIWVFFYVNLKFVKCIVLPSNAVDPYIVLSCTIDEIPLAFSVPSCNRRASCLSIAEANAAFSFCFDSVRVAFVEQEFEHLSRPARQTCRGCAAPNTAWALSTCHGQHGRRAEAAPRRMRHGQVGPDRWLVVAWSSRRWLERATCRVPTREELTS